MRRILFDEKLEFEIHVIGYKEKGESILFFLKADDKVAYSGLVDCYETNSENVALQLLEENGIKRFNFVCWTHPHDDHTIGLDRILTEFSDESTFFWMPPILSTDIDKYTTSTQEVYKKIFGILESKKRTKMRIREASDSKILEKLFCYGNVSPNPYVFEIKSFAPDSMLIAERKIREKFNVENLYSIGLIINIGLYYIILGGDVENRTLKLFPDYGVNDKIDYIKIPHHASQSASGLIDRMNSLGISAPEVATTTVFRIHNLPDINILKRYIAWGKDLKIYSSGSIVNADMNSMGIISTNFDVLGKREIPIQTSKSGNAVCINDEIAL